MSEIKCPRCGSAGRSVASLHYAESASASGDVSVSGMGIGSGGLGFGFGSGIYSGKSSSKRAEIFEEPKPFLLPVLSIIFLGVLMAIGISCEPGFLSFLAQQPEPQPSSATAAASDQIQQIIQECAAMLKYLAPVLAIGAIIWAFSRARDNWKEQERLNTEEYPRQLARYHELQYCEACHTLYDRQGHARDANQKGFHEMMALPEEDLNT
jgi:hypothetical protein